MHDPDSDLNAQLANLPKVDLHRHLEGSLRFETILDLARHEGVDLPHDEDTLKGMVQVQPEEPHTSANFLAKFLHLRKLFRSPEIIRRVTCEVIEDAAIENVRYLELHFTPVALAEAGGFPLSEVIDWVVDATFSATTKRPLRVGLIVSVNRHEPIEVAEKIVQIVTDQMDRGIVGLSLAGDELGYSAAPFASLLSGAQEAGLGLTIHAGEWTGSETVRHALEAIGTTRIGHGVRVMEDAKVIALARDRRAFFEVCLTSNVHSGVVETIDLHPLPDMIQAGLQVTLNTDDPGVSDTNLTQEYLLAVKDLGLSLVSIHGMILAAVQASFLSRKEKAALEAELLASFESGV